VSLALVAALALLVGLALGTLGGGGSILAVPLLVYVAGLDSREAIATSLLVVGVTSAAALVSHARGGRVRWRTALVFGGAGVAGAYGGGRLAALVPETWLLVAFAVVMVATAVAMIRGRKEPHAAAGASPRARVVRLLVLGAAVGVVSGLVGAGGGFLVVPALTLLGGLEMPAAVGTSLLVLTMNAAAGFAGHLGDVTLDWGLAVAVTAAAVLGSLVGGRLAGRVPAGALRTGFGWFVLVTGVGVLVEQAPAHVVSDALADPVVQSGLAGLALLLLGVGAVRLGRLATSRTPR
jgi:uncharacterized protein